MAEFPNRFFRYFDFKGAFETIETRNIRWAHTSTLNDPFDCKINVGEPPDINNPNINECLAALSNDPKFKLIIGMRDTPGWDDNLNIFLNNIFRDFRIHALSLPSLIKSIMDINYILSLTTEFNNLLMWAHYTNNHTGAVIEFSPEKNNAFCAAEEVKYRDDIPRLFGTERDCIEFAIKGSTPESRKEIYDLCVLTKSSHWKYEKEWRITCPWPEAKGLPHYDVRLNDYDIKSLYLGCQMGLVNKNNIIKLVNHEFPSANVFIAKPNESRFSLDFVNL